MFRRLGRLLRGLLIATGAFVLVVTFTPLVPWAVSHMPHTWSDTDHGILIVLGGSSVTLPAPEARRLMGLDTYWRCIHAVYVWRHGHFKTLVVTGAHSGETMKPFFVEQGIPASDIQVEDAAGNTHENALFTKPILHGRLGPFVVLTSDYHVYRAGRCFAKEDIPVEVIPAPDLGKRAALRLERWNVFWEMLREYAAIAGYRARGWI